MSIKPAMPDNLRQLASVAIDKHNRRFAVPALAIARDANSNLNFDCPYRDEDAGHWEALLFEAFGSRSASTVTTFLRQLGELCGHDWCGPDNGWRPNLEELNAAIVIIAGTKPENEAQACIAAQMVALHFTAMKLGAVVGKMTSPDERTAATLARVAKAYATLSRTIAQLQGKATRHEQHFHYHDERHVHVGDGRNNGGQPHIAREISIESELTGDEERATLPGPCSNDGQSMSIAGGERKAGLPLARRLSRLRRTFGIGERIL